MRKFLNLLSMLAMVMMVSVALWFYLTTDKMVVPMHWNAIGDIDNYGKTWTILVLAAVGVCCFSRRWLLWTSPSPFPIPSAPDH